jgi:hypothetical protein
VPAAAPLACGDSHCLAGPETPCAAERFWFDADYLLWWVKKGPTLPLVSTGPATDAFPGALDQPHTTILFGDHGLRYDTFNGVRLDAGMWLTSDQSLGIEAGWFTLEKRSAQYSANGGPNGQFFIGRPFVNADTNEPNVYFVSNNMPGPLGASLNGSISIYSGSRLDGWETNLVSNVYQSGTVSARLIGGFRMLNLDEDLRIDEQFGEIVPGIGGGASFLGVPVAPPGSLATFDSFVAHNWFYGPQLGGRIDWRSGKLSVDVTTKVALGVTQELVTIDGGSTLLNAGVPVVTVPGGVLAQRSNIGRYTHDEFAVVPEFGLNIGYQLTPWLQARVGYTFLYWSAVARPGAQIDGAINPALVPTDFTFGTPGGPNRPAFSPQQSDFWAQGINFGLAFRF